jgi:ketosteroid isomerase-like protein
MRVPLLATSAWIRVLAAGAVVGAAVGVSPGCHHDGPAIVAASPMTQTTKEAAAAARATIDQWRAAYEARDVAALTRLYTAGVDVVVVQQGTALLGQSSVQAMLKDRLDRAKEIHVRLKDIQVDALGPTAAVAIVTMAREVSDGVTSVAENGTLTLTLRQEPEGWRIVTEHYSYRSR